MYFYDIFTCSLVVVMHIQLGSFLGEKKDIKTVALYFSSLEVAYYLNIITGECLSVSFIYLCLQHNLSWLVIYLSYKWWYNALSWYVFNLFVVAVVVFYVADIFSDKIQISIANIYLHFAIIDVNGIVDIIRSNNKAFFIAICQKQIYMQSIPKVVTRLSLRWIVDTSSPLHHCSTTLSFQRPKSFF